VAYVDPGFPAAWRKEPYYSALKGLATEGIEHDKQVPVYVDIRGRTFVLLPNDDVDLGVLAPDDRIVIRRRAGQGWEAFKAPALRG
jgi:hypothetical protein